MVFFLRPFSVWNTLGCARIVCAPIPISYLPNTTTIGDLAKRLVTHRSLVYSLLYSSLCSLSLFFLFLHIYPTYPSRGKYHFTLLFTPPTLSPACAPSHCYDRLPLGLTLTHVLRRLLLGSPLLVAFVLSLLLFYFHAFAPYDLVHDPRK